MIEYKRPIIEKKKFGKGLIGEITINYNHTDSDGLAIPYRLIFFRFFSTIGMPDGTEYKLDKSEISDSQKNKLRRFTVLKEKCSSASENLNDSLRSFLTQYYDDEKESREINNLSFSEQRDCLSDILKKDNLFFSIEGLQEPEKRKKFRKLFADLIADRNIYTHGKICLRLNDDSIFLFYSKKNLDGQWGCIIDDNIIESYFNAYNFISETLKKMLNKLNENKTI